MPVVVPDAVSARKKTPDGVRSVRAAVLISAVSFLVSVYLAFAPRVDVAVSALFYDVLSGRFSPQAARFFEVLHRLSEMIALAAFAVMAGYGVHLFLRRKRGLFEQQALPSGPAALPPAPYVRRLYALAACAFVWALGPGLIINGLLKTFWGRARPLQTTDFGGDKLFSPAWIISDQCASNCSFSSGDPSVACALAALGFLDSRARGLWLAASVAAAVLLGYGRIALGKHYLSDVAATFGVCYALYAVAALSLLRDGGGERCR